MGSPAGLLTRNFGIWELETFRETRRHQQTILQLRCACNLIGTLCLLPSSTVTHSLYLNLIVQYCLWLAYLFRLWSYGTMMLYNDAAFGLVSAVRTWANHMLGTEILHQGSSAVHDELLLGKGYLLPAVEQADTQVRVWATSDDSILSMDTIHSSLPGRPIFSHWTLNTEFIAHLQLDSRIAEYIIKVQ